VHFSMITDIRLAEVPPNLLGHGGKAVVDHQILRVNRRHKLLHPLLPLRNSGQAARNSYAVGVGQVDLWLNKGGGSEKLGNQGRMRVHIFQGTWRLEVAYYASSSSGATGPSSLAGPQPPRH